MASARVLPAWLDSCFPDELAATAKRAFACRRCLDGWMAALEAQAQPTLAPMVLGHPVVLAQQNQETVARWALKSVLALQTVRDPGVLPPALFADFRQIGLPPNGFRVTVALRPREPGWPYRFAATGSAATRRAWEVEPAYPQTGIDHYRAELCVGHLVIRAGAPFAPSGHGVERLDGIEIWPLGAPVRWPAKRGSVRDRREAEGRAA